MPRDHPNDTEYESVEEGGYVRLAEHFSRNPQLAILRRFAALANQNLLYYNAELSELEAHLKVTQKQDNESGDESRKHYARNWIPLSESSYEELDCPRREQYDMIMKLRKLMAEYHQALYFYKEMLALRSPHEKLLGDLREWMHRPSMGRIRILSWDWRTWETCDDDLITFENSTMDRLTSLMTYKIVDVYHNLIGRRIHGAAHRQTVTYTHRSIARFTRAFTVFIACILPVVAIVILYIVQNMAMRMGIIVILTGLFSLSMSLLTMASLQEIFSATATFSAVLVVFLGSTTNC